MRVRLCAMMRKPASSIMALIAPVKLRAVASGLMIEKVRSIAITLFFEEETAGEPIAAAYSERAVARQGVTKACVNQARPWGKGQNGNAGELPFQRGGKAAASRKLIRGSCCFSAALAVSLRFCADFFIEASLNPTDRSPD